MAQKTDVLIIGAGVSGIAAARELTQQGFQVIILEARDRIGGRIHTVQPWGNPTDLGASWIHKINNNPLTAIAQKYKIPLIPTNYSHDNVFSMLQSATIFDSDGNKMDKTRVNAAIEELKKFTHYLDAHVESYNEHFSVTDALNKYMIKNSMSEDSLNLLVHINGDTGEYENGTQIANTSYKVAHDTHSVTSGTDVTFSYGYSQLLSKLTENIPILLNQVVTKVDYDQDDVVVYTKDQREFHAKYIISTLPLGVLKKGTVEFSPQLPQIKLDAIKRIGMGVYNKVYLLFDTPFWDKQTEWIVFLSEKKKTHEDFEVMNYYPQSKQPILLVFTTGSFASQLEHYSDKETIDRIMGTLRASYGPKTPYPTSYIITRWGSDPYAHGSFSYPKVGSSGDDYKILAQPVLNRLFFAGEATSTTDPSTVTGAYLAGIRAAEEISHIAAMSDHVKA